MGRENQHRLAGDQYHRVGQRLQSRSGRPGNDQGRLFDQDRSGEPVDRVDGKKTENDEKDKKGKYLRREFSYSRFQQIMVLPENVEKDKIDAKVENGVLTIDIPKKVVEPEEKKMKEIAIK